MKVGIATNHGGFGLNLEELVAQLYGAGHEVVDFGAHKLKPDGDYPDFPLSVRESEHSESPGYRYWGINE
jgi:ribose 5-phosphate isomerase RpiB